MKECYDEWHASPNVPWAVIYYNMDYKQHRFVNGPVLKVIEDVSYFGFHSEDVSVTDEVEIKLELASRCLYFHD
jgi:hypothetical protein